MISRTSTLSLILFVLFASPLLISCDSTVSVSNQDGPVADGDEPDGDVVDGDEPDGDVLDGDEPDGDIVDGDEPDGDWVDGDEPDGDVLDGDEPDGDIVDGDEPDGDQGLNYEDLMLGEPTDLPLTVSDIAVVSSSLYVGADLPIWETYLDLKMTHPFWEDLEITLTHPTGRQVVFSGLSGSSEAGVVRTLSTTDFVGFHTQGEWTVSLRDTRPADDGLLTGWILRFAPPTDAVNPLDEPLPRLIPDHDGDGIGHRQAMPAVQELSSLCLDVSIRNGFAGDYRIELKTPTGLRRVILERGQEQGDFGTRTFYTEAIRGTFSAGYWTIYVSDLLEGDEGSLTAWSLDFNCPDPADVVDGDEEMEEDGDLDGDNDGYEDGDEELDLDGDEEDELEEEEEIILPDPAGSCTTPNEVESLPFSREGTTTDGQMNLVPPATCAGWTMNGPESVYAVTLTEGQDITVELSDVSVNFNPGLYVLGACDSAADFCTGRDRGREGEGEWVYFQAPADGTYYIVVDSGEAEDVGEFTLDVAEGAPYLPGEREYNPTDAFPVTLPATTTIISYIQVPMAFEVDSVCVTVDITHPYIGLLSIKLQSPEGTVRTLHNRAGGSADDIHRTYEVHNFNEENARGEWMLTVRNYGNANNVGTLDGWNMVFGCAPRNAPAPADDDDDDDDDDLNSDDSVACSQDQFGNNHTIETAWPIDVPTSYEDLMVCYNGDDFYSFNLSAGQVLNVSASFIDNNGDIDIYLYGPNPTNSTTSSTASSAGTSNSESFTKSITTDGQYVLKVRMFTSSATTGQPYDLTINVH